MTRSPQRPKAIPSPTAADAVRGADLTGRPADAPIRKDTPTAGGDLREPSVAELLRLIERPDEDVLGFDALCELEEIAAEVIDDLLAAFDANRGNTVVRRRLGDLLANARVRDERIRAALLELLVEDPAAGASWLAEYGDRTVVPALLRAFDATKLDAAHTSPASALHESGEPHEDAYVIGSAVSLLGGVLSPAQRAKLDEVMRRRDAAFAAFLAMPVPPSPRPRERQSRNSACRCGSGRKYKKCHLSADVAEALTGIVGDA